MVRQRSKMMKIKYHKDVQPTELLKNVIHLGTATNLNWMTMHILFMTMGKNICQVKYKTSFLSSVLYILTSVWVLHTQNAGQNLLFPCFAHIFARF